jgi:hypothetical protein
MTGVVKSPIDDLTKTTVTVAWVVILNKPFYPIYVWWLIGSGARMSMVTLVSLPFFLAIPFVATRSSLAARIALPLVGTIDTVLDSAVFGKSSATLLFLAPCMALSMVSSRPDEKWWQRGFVCLVFVFFVVSWWQIGPAAFPWGQEQTSTLVTINVFSVATLMVFIGLRYSGIAKVIR